MGDNAPNPPIPESAASVTRAQSTENRAAGTESQAGSMTNQVNPYGNLNYTQSGVGPNGVPIYTANSSYSPQLQNILSNLWGGTLSQLSGSGYGNGNAATTIGDATSGNTAALMDRQLTYLTPYLRQQTEAEDNRLRNQGIFPSATGNPSDPTNPSAYDTAMNNLRDSQFRSMSGYLAQVEPAMYQQALQNYLTPLQISQSMMQMANPNTLTGSFINPPQLNIQPANYEQANANVNQMNQMNYQSQLAQQQNMMQGLFGMGGAVLGGLARTPAASAGLTALGGMI